MLLTDSSVPYITQQKRDGYFSCKHSSIMKKYCSYITVQQELVIDFIPCTLYRMCSVWP